MYACYNVSLISSIIGGGDIYLPGSLSAIASSQIAPIVETTSQYDIYVTGQSTGMGASFRNANVLYAFGDHAAYQSPKIEYININFIWAYGREAVSSRYTTHWLFCLLWFISSVCYGNNK